MLQKPVLVVEDDRGRREFILDAPSYSVGRDAACDIRLVSQFVSRRHAMLVQIPNDDGSFDYRIVDGDNEGRLSANGLIVNQRKVKTWDLVQEDEIIFGPKVRAIYYKFFGRNSTPPDDKDFPPDPDAFKPRQPSPFPPELDADAVADEGISQTP